MLSLLFKHVCLYIYASIKVEIGKAESSIITNNNYDESASSIPNFQFSEYIDDFLYDPTQLLTLKGNSFRIY
jgi:hypothetical protein